MHLEEADAHALCEPPAGLPLHLARPVPLSLVRDLVSLVFLDDCLEALEVLEVGLGFRTSSVLEVGLGFRASSVLEVGLAGLRRLGRLGRL